MMMKLAALLLATAAILATGCPGLGCGGYTGGGDRVFARDADSLILCENGGFVATTIATDGTTTTIEGLIVTDASDDATVGVVGDTGADLFTLDDQTDDSVTTDGFGSAAWAQQDLGQVALDHANVHCTDLTTRSWWTAQ